MAAQPRPKPNRETLSNQIPGGFFCFSFLLQNAQNLSNFVSQAKSAEI
jgi:hypothetical protein